jgi:RNA polymerase sigma factor (sigma-70 family)
VPLSLAQRLWNERLRMVRSEAARKGNRKRWAAVRERERQALILRHMDLVRRIARQVHRLLFHVPIEDLLQSGYVGLAEAALRYRPENGDFEHYCYFRVRGSMIDANRRNAYREQQHDSVEAFVERVGYVPARLAVDRAPLPDQLAERREIHLMLSGAVRRLPGELREVMEAHLAEQDLEGVAERHGRSVAWARARLKLAREAVTEAMRERAA